jgi:multiple sugar transport system permease protein
VSTARRNSFVRHVQRGLLYALLIIVSLLFLVPVFGTVLTSLRTNGDISRNGFWSVPEKITLANYRDAWTRGQLTKYFQVTIISTVPSLVGLMFVASLGGYALSRIRFKGSAGMLLFIVSFMLVPPQILLIPLYQMFNLTHLINSYRGYILVQIAMNIPFSTFLMRNFLATLPYSLQDAGRIDGCTEFGIYWRIILPLAKPALAVLCILQFTFIWNEFVWGLVLMTDKRPIMVGLISLQGQYNTVWALQCAAALLASIPTLGVFLAFQRYYIDGLTAGAVKG